MIILGTFRDVIAMRQLVLSSFDWFGAAADGLLGDKEEDGTTPRHIITKTDEAIQRSDIKLAFVKAL